MLSKKRRCPECDYGWAPYLDFPTCPRCGSDLAAARLFLEKNRLRRIVIVSVVVGAAVSVLAEVLPLLFK